MPSLRLDDPAQFVADFYVGFTRDLLSSEVDAGPIVDRYHTRDIVQCADGQVLDRERLVAHTRPVRKNRPRGRIDVYEALAAGDRLAARYRLHLQDRRGSVAMEVHFFGQYGGDDRLRRAHLLTRMLADAEPTSGTPIASEALGLVEQEA